MNNVMFGFFNLGGAEILLILAVMIVVAVVVGGVILLAVFLIRQGSRGTPTVGVPPPLQATPPSQTCPRCGAPLPAGAPQGLCPRCVLGVGLATHTEAPGESGPHGTKVTQPPLAPADIASHFPQLEILECLGRGGMGVVYKARQPKLNRLVALKILAPEKGADPRFAERFLREAQALARLSHPNIVTVHDFGEADGLYYLLMEYVDGVTLRQLLQTRKIAPEEALGIVPKICEALQFAHEQGVVHRDIKPENVLLDKQGRVKIADFGIAKLMGGTPLTLSLSPSGGEKVSASTGEGTLTQDQVLGTPHYMAPEQVATPQLVDHRADIYSLGVVFYEMLTGELPLGKFQPPSKKVQVDVRLDEVVLHALEKEPERRYQQASEVKTAVETIASTPDAKAQTARAQSPTNPVRVLRWRDLWIWDTSNVVALAMVPMVISFALTGVLLPFWGKRALLCLLLWTLGLAFAGIYAWVGARVRGLKAALPRPTGEVAECLMFRRPFQAPGLAVLHNDRLELIPVVGSPIKVILEDIVAVKEVRWFNGTRLWWKKGFVLELANGQRVGVAIPEPFARRWRSRLSRGTLPEIPANATMPESRSAPGKPGGWVTAARWTARILGTLLLAIYGLFVLGQGLPPMGSQPEGVQLSFVAVGLMLLGFLVGWKWEGAAALLIAAGWTLWHINEGRIGWNAFQTPLPVAALYGFCWWATRGRRTAVVVETVAALALVLVLGRLFVPTSVFVSGVIHDAATGRAIANAELTLLRGAASPGAKEQGPNARSDKNGHFSLYVGWYAKGKQVRVSAPGYGTLTTNLGPRQLGQRRVNRDFHLPNANAADSGVLRSGQVRIPDGTVELAGISRQPSAGQAWWKSDGSLLASQPWRVDPKFRQQAPHPPEEQLPYFWRQFVLQASGVTEPARIMDFAFDGQPGANGNFDVVLGDQKLNEWQGLVKSFPKGQTNTQLRVGVGSGPFQAALETNMMRFEKLSFVGEIGEVRFTVGKVFERERRAAFNLSVELGTKAVWADIEYRLRGKDQRGQWHTARIVEGQSTGGLVNEVYVFDELRPKDLAEVRFETRPVYWVEFGDIALHPGQATAATAQAVPSAPRAATTLPNLFSPVTERVLHSVSIQRPIKAEDLDGGREIEVPGQLEKEGEEQLFHWLAVQGADLLAFAHKQSWDLWVAPKLASVPATIWERPAVADVLAALKSGTAGLERTEPDVKEGFSSYRLGTNAAFPLTFAFQTSTGGLGLLQVTGFTDNPRGVKICYKLLE